DHQQPQRQQTDRQRQQPAEKFAEEQAVAVDRLGQYPAQRAAIELPIDRIKGEGDRDQRDQKARQRDERRQGVLRQRQQAQEEERARADRLANRADGRVGGGDRGEENQRFEDAHARARQVVGGFFGDNRAEPGPGRAAPDRRRATS